MKINPPSAEAVVQFKLEPGALPPTRATEGSAGYDLHYLGDFGVIYLDPGDRIVLSTGVSLAIPAGFEGQIRSRSGMGIKHGVIAFPGTIDSDFRGVVVVSLTNTGSSPYRIHSGERIAQLVIQRVPEVGWEEVGQLPPSGTTRTGGLGSTGA